MPTRLQRAEIGLESLITLSVLSVGILAGTVGLAYAYWNAKQSLYETVGTAFQELARQSSENLALLLSKEVEWIQRFSNAPEVRESVLEGLRPRLDDPALRRQRDRYHPYFRSFTIINRDGRMTGGYTSEATRVHYAQLPWWPVVFESGRSWVSPLSAEENGRRFLEIVVPIYDGEGAVIGALKAVIEASSWFGRENGRIGRTGHVMILSDTGMVLACPLLDPPLHRLFVPGPTQENHGPLPLVVGRRVTPEDTHGRFGGIIGFASVRVPVGIVPAQGWSVLVTQDPSETYAPLRVLMWKLAGVWAVAMGFVVWLRWRLAKRIVAPISELNRRMALLGQRTGVAACGTLQPSGIREIDCLAVNFDELADRLERHSRERQRYVAELEQLNHHLRMSEEHYRLLWDHSVDAKILVDKTGAIRDVNRRAEMKLRASVGAMVGQPVGAWFVEADRPRLERLCEAVFHSGCEQSAGEMQVMTAVGTSLIMDVDLTPVAGPIGVDTVLLQLIDLTERKELERQLVRTERLASLSQFASMFAHDIRNPLAGIKKTLEWLAQRPELNRDPQRSWLDDLRFTTDLLLGMIHDMLDVYQESYSGLPLSVSEVSVTKLAEDVLHVFRSEAAARNIRLQLVVPPHNQPLVTVDSRRMQRVLINLVHNALKYSPARAVITLTIRTEPTPDAPAGTEFSMSPSRLTSISVEDEGPGIASEDLPHIFELFFRKKDGQDYRIGRGLGLHFCRLVVEAHHGTIRASNRLEGGARFTVELPVRQEDPCLSLL